MVNMDLKAYVSKWRALKGYDLIYCVAKDMRYNSGMSSEYHRIMTDVMGAINSVRSHCNEIAYRERLYFVECCKTTIIIATRFEYGRIIADTIESELNKTKVSSFK